MIPGETSLDSSVVLRLLMGEPVGQCRQASHFLKGQLAAGFTVQVGDLVLAEVYFALQSFYQLSKKDALEALSLFIQHSGVVVTQTAHDVLALPNLAAAKPGFVDRLILGDCQAQGRTLVTFEKSAKKLPGTHILPSV